MKGSHTVEIVRNGSPKIVHINCLKPYMKQTLDCGYGTDYEVTKINILGKDRVISLGGRSNPGVCRQQGKGLINLKFLGVATF